MGLWSVHCIDVWGFSNVHDLPMPPWVKFTRLSPFDALAIIWEPLGIARVPFKQILGRSVVF